MKELNYLDITKTGQGHIKLPSATGIHPDMGVGTAQQIQTNIHESDSTPYVFRKTPYNSTRESGDIVGASVAWNQLTENGDFATATGWVGRQSSISIANNVATVVPNSTGTERGLTQTTSGSTIANHIYLLSCSFRTNVATNLKLSFAGSNQVTFTVPSTNTWTDCKVLWTSTSSAITRFCAYTKESVGTSAVLEFMNCYSVDLTLALGSTIADYIYTLESGTAGAGVAKLKEWGFCTEDYYAYNAGGIESVNVSKHIMRDGDDNIIGEYALDSDLTLRGILKLDGSNNLYADGDVYHSDGTVDRNWAERAYQAGDASDGSTMITDGTTTVYKLQTPTTETADPYTEVQVCSPYGTEEFVDAGVAAGTRDVAIPCGHNTEYMKNIVGAIEGIPLPPTTNGNYKLRCTVASGVPTYSWVSE